MNYKHTQKGYLMITALLGVIILFVVILTQTIDFPILLLMFAILILIISFTSLKVEINKKYLKIKFGYGIYKKQFLLKEIKSVKQVKNHWYYGWGIRLWLWPYMWIFNVSGFDAVEIKMKDKKIYRIGTDEPKKLKQTLKKVI